MCDNPSGGIGKAIEEITFRELQSHPKCGDLSRKRTGTVPSLIVNRFLVSMRIE
jgi:hypothetical protein